MPVVGLSSDAPLPKSHDVPAEHRINHKPLVVSFSGMDGSGKSTNIAALTTALAGTGLRVKLVTFWDDVVVLSRYRAKISTAVLGGETGVGTPEKPVRRRDKNFRPWYATFARCVLHFFDALHLRVLLQGLIASDVDVIIFDRYIYDQLAGLQLERGGLERYARFLLKVSPHPDVCYLLDAEPETAYARKPEYPPEFLRSYRRSYLKLSEMLPQLIVISPAPLYEIHCRVLTGITSVGIRLSQTSQETAPA
jgi:thymidylate kinase